MALDIYWIGLLVLVPTVAFTAGRGVILRPFRRKRTPGTSEGREKPASSSPSPLAPGRRHEEIRKFRWTFLQVYLLVMGSEWLQGPYMYTLLRDEKGLPARTVALLYATAYGSAAAYAAFAGVTGRLTDRLGGGRRAACLAFCAVHCLASASVLSGSLAVLVAGRVAGGVAIALLWTAFESWMVAEWNARGLGGGGYDEDGDDDEDGEGRWREQGQGMAGIGAMFGLMTTANCITAILAGFLAHCVVLALGSKTDPFLVGMALDVCAAVLMLCTWNESRSTGRPGDGYAPVSAVTSAADGTRCELGETPAPSPAAHRSSSPEAHGPTGSTMKPLRDPRVWVLSFVSCCFEGTNFLLRFSWPGALQEAHAREHPDEAGDGANAVPYGVTFACFMGTMVLGALLFNALARHHHHHHHHRRHHRRHGAGARIDVGVDSDPGPETGSDNGSGSGSDSSINGRSWMSAAAAATALLTPTRLLAAALFLAAASFLAAGLARGELHLFATFLVLEACNGVYVPSIAFHRCAVVADDEGRAGVYGLMNVPLFVLVVVALCTTTGSGGGGDHGGEHRQTVFFCCAGLLLAATVATMVGLRGIGRQREFSQLPGQDGEDVRSKDSIQ